MLPCPCQRLHLMVCAAKYLRAGDAEVRIPTGGHQGGSWLCAFGGAFLGLLGQHFFFCTGHTSQFAGLQYTAGFVGYDEFNYVRAGFLLASNTFGPQILTTLLVRLLLLVIDDCAFPESAPFPSRPKSIRKCMCMTAVRLAISYCAPAMSL